MGNEPEKLDRLIDEALRDLTTGAPHEGFRGRVMARIAATPEVSPVRFIVILGWRARPFQLAAAGAAAALGLIAILVAPSMLLRGGPKPGETTTAANPPAAAPQVPKAAPAPRPGAVVQLQEAARPSPLRTRRTVVQRAADTTQARAADEEPGPITRVHVNPLPDPDPIANKAIEIKSVQIEELTIPEIQVRPLDADRAKRDDK
jgi:hypothetical protein